MRDYPTLHLVTKSSKGTVFLLLSNMESDFCWFSIFPDIFSWNIKFSDFIV